MTSRTFLEVTVNGLPGPVAQEDGRILTVFAAEEGAEDLRALAPGGVAAGAGSQQPHFSRRNQ